MSVVRVRCLFVLYSSKEEHIYSVLELWNLELYTYMPELLIGP